LADGTDILRPVALWPVVASSSSGAQMDGSRFDTLARSLGTTGSRRRALAGLLAGALGLLAFRAEETAARKRKGKPKKRKKGGLTCPSGYTACGQQCVDIKDNTLHCGACFVVCSPGKTCCNGVCANLQDDDNHCSVCGQRCRTNDIETARLSAAEICSNGACVDCSIAGNIRDGNPTTCCRGLKFCPGASDGSSASKCVPAGQTCP
jgi:hypothetical protein